MAREITMPKLSDTMEEGKILRWLKHPGDTIRRGEAIAEVETDKADMIMEAFDEGVLGEIVLKEGESAKVGVVIARLGEPGKQAAQAAPAPPAAEARPRQKIGAAPAQSSAPAPPAAVRGALAAVPPKRTAQGIAEAGQPGASQSPEPAPAEPQQAPVQQAQEGGADGLSGLPEFYSGLSAHSSAAPTTVPAPPPARAVAAKAETATAAATPADAAKLKASPLARRAAEEAGIDLATVRGTGPDGRVTKRDIDNFVREQQMFRFRRLIAPREGALGTRQELTPMRRTIAQRMAASKREIPHFYVTVEVDMEEAVRFKSSIEAAELFDEDITYNDIVIRACALAICRHSRMNASFEDETVVIRPHVNIGVAVAVEDGLLIPVIRECERLSLPEIARISHRLVGKAGRGGYTADELSGGTFTISN
ncbi:MAG: 2-oxo acid dehydrogenase subunit E2, partial [Deltaproteobacteria bacterium]|nr:2-oxo acid dehydrogenase subunit E2 [Deltaproteobacteria bacterium]